LKKENKKIAELEKENTALGEDKKVIIENLPFASLQYTKLPGDHFERPGE